MGRRFNGALNVVMKPFFYATDRAPPDHFTFRNPLGKWFFTTPFTIFPIPSG